MAAFLFATACSDCRVRDVAEAQRVIDSYAFDPDLTVKVRRDSETGSHELVVYGYGWPEA